MKLSAAAILLSASACNLAAPQTTPPTTLPGTLPAPQAVVQPQSADPAPVAAVPPAPRTVADAKAQVPVASAKGAGADPLAAAADVGAGAAPAADATASFSLQPFDGGVAGGTGGLAFFDGVSVAKTRRFRMPVAKLTPVETP